MNNLNQYSVDILKIKRILKRLSYLLDEQTVIFKK